MAFTTLVMTAGPDDDGRRADRVLRILLHDLPLAEIYRLFRMKAVRVSGKAISLHEKIHDGDDLTVRVPEALVPAGDSPAPTDAAADRTFAAMVLVETDDVIVVNKPRGILTHGPGGIDELAFGYLRQRREASLSFRPAPLHRLDRNTTGILVVSASIRGARAFTRSLRDGRVRKEYLAIVDGRLEGAAMWSDMLGRLSAERRTVRDDAGGKSAALTATPLGYAGERTLARVEPATGLTHQIRAQCALHGHPLAGDAKYGGSRLAGGYVLHCARIEVPSDIEADIPPSVEAPLPDAAARLIAELGFRPQSVAGA